VVGEIEMDMISQILPPLVWALIFIGLFGFLVGVGFPMYLWAGCGVSNKYLIVALCCGLVFSSFIGGGMYLKSISTQQYTVTGVVCDKQYFANEESNKIRMDDGLWYYVKSDDDYASVHIGDNVTLNVEHTPSFDRWINLSTVSIGKTNWSCGKGACL
jgi:vacuolar-type H+-ATPase subunit I/STV1